MPEPVDDAKVFRLAIVATHPIQYQAPLFRQISQSAQIDLTVYYLSDHGVAPARVDPGFGIAYQWDVPVLEGYPYRFLRNWSPVASVSKVWGLFNPGIIPELRRNRYDAVLVMGWASPSCLLAFLGARLSRTPILIYGDSVSIERRPWWIRLAKRAVLSVLFRSFSAFLISGAFNRQFYARFGVPDRRMHWFPWAIDNEFFRKQAQDGRLHRTDLCCAYDISAEKPLIVFAGKLLPRKRPLDLLRAYQSLAAPAALMFVGDGELRAQIEDEVSRNGLADVRITGFVNQQEIGRLYGAADVFCLPSEHDPRGTVVNEAMASGLPVVISNGVGVWGENDIVRHEVNGFVFPVGDVAALTRYLDRLASDRALRQAMGQQSQAIIAHWSYAECVVGLRRALESVAF